MRSRSRLPKIQFTEDTNRKTQMTEERKHAILLAATLLSARKIYESDLYKPNPAKDFYVDRAIVEAANILEKIDKKWPPDKTDNTDSNTDNRGS